MLKVTVRMTSNLAAMSDLFVEVDDARTSMPVASFASIKAAAKWLADGNYHYVTGSNGLWAKQ